VAASRVSGIAKRVQNVSVEQRSNRGGGHAGDKRSAESTVVTGGDREPTGPAGAHAPAEDGTIYRRPATASPAASPAAVPASDDPDRTRVTPTAGRRVTTAPAAPDGSELAVGSVLANTFVIERKVGEGGMGAVYLATHLTLGTAHAIKVIRGPLLEDRTAVELFKSEVMSLRAIRHDAVANCESLLSDDAGALYLVMEFVEGPSLKTRIGQGQMTPAEVRALAVRVAEGLQAAHEQGVIHRDVSPDNILLPQERPERAKIIDFGIAKRLAAERTIIGPSFGGKLSYASPEQLGLFPTIDHRTDIYSLGLVLIAAATGRRPAFDGTESGAIRARRLPPDLTGVPAELHGLIGAMLEPDPADRPGSMRAVIDRVRGEPFAGDRAGGRADAATGRSKRRTGMTAGLVAAAVVVVGGVGLWYAAPWPPPPPPDPPRAGPLPPRETPATSGQLAEAPGGGSPPADVSPTRTEPSPAPTAADAGPTPGMPATSAEPADDRVRADDIVSMLGPRAGNPPAVPETPVEPGATSTEPPADQFATRPDDTPDPSPPDPLPPAPPAPDAPAPTTGDSDAAPPPGPPTGTDDAGTVTDAGAEPAIDPAAPPPGGPAADPPQPVHSPPATLPETPATPPTPPTGSAEETVADGPPPAAIPSAADSPAGTDDPVQVAVLPPSGLDPAARAKLAAEAESAAATACGSVAVVVTDTGELLATGVVGSDSQKLRIETDWQQLPGVASVESAVQILAPPLCVIAQRLDLARLTDGDDRMGPLVRLNEPRGRYREGDLLQVSVTSAASIAGFLYIEYFAADGAVLHMAPTWFAPDYRVTRGATLKVGQIYADEPGVPLPLEATRGRDMIVAVWSPVELFPPRCSLTKSGDLCEEDGIAYAETLITAIAKQRAQDPDHPPMAGVAYLEVAGPTP
jgi:hypothetical protein